jgi:hypothetical protein
VKFFRHLLGITKLDKEKIDVLRKKWGTVHSKGNKTVTEKVSKTRTEDGHKQNTKTGTTIQGVTGGTDQTSGECSLC